MYFFILIFVQIILETFPVSSSGQLALLETLFKTIKYNINYSLALNKVISYFLHGPTVFVLALFFFNRWFFLLHHIRRCWKIILKLLFFVIVADGVTFLFFLLFSFFGIKTFFPLGVGFAISALALLSLKFLMRRQTGKITFYRALLLGIVQGISLLPGISRFGLTFVAACWLGISSQRAFEFSFAMQWPLIFVGFLYSLRFMVGPFFYAYRNLFSIDILTFLMIATVISFFTLTFVQRLILEKRIWIFSIFLTISFVVWIFLQYL